MKLLLKFIFLSLTFFPFFSSANTTILPPTKILLVPGHDDVVWGAQYGNTKEADMNLRLATELFNILKKDKRFEVHITRDSRGYTKEFAEYFANHKDEVLAFMANAKERMGADVADGDFIEKENPPHNAASADVALRLYGFNKWANENKMDAMIHIHFNDYVRKTKWVKGKYKGFAIYMPDAQFANGVASQILASSIFTQLEKKYTTSTNVNEIGGLVPDQKLIALGANNTLISSVRSVLVEYGYIYRFSNSAMRQRAYKDMAALSAKGIKNYFFYTQF